jgi:clan AA aspartic protease (TIGR02281 family)
VHPDKLAAFVQPGLAGGASWISFRAVAVLAVIVASLLAHGNILWIGLRDTGFASGRLGVELKTREDWRLRLSRYQDEEYELSKRASSRTGSSSDLINHIKRLFRRLTESFLFQVMIGCSLGVILIAGWLYYSYTTGFGVPAPVKAGLAHDAAPPGAIATPRPSTSSAELSRDAPAPADAAPVITHRIVTREREGSAERDADGRYIFDVVVNDVKMSMRYDDGIPLVTIRAEDAIRLGISFSRLDFATKIRTAKGSTDVAGITINAITVGSITYHLVPGFVARPGALDENILGHSFLGRLAAYRLEGNRLIMIDRQGQSQAVLANRNMTR